MKQCKQAIVKPLQIIINQALTTGIFPDKLKIAKVQPIYKNEDQTLIKNYRPISILPAISKVFEKIIYNQLKSKMGEIQTGVPQGSILGRLLFIIYIYDIKTSTELFNVITYADDTNLISTLGSFNSNQQQNSVEQNINEELNKISGWLIYIFIHGRPLGSYDATLRQNNI